MTACRGLGRGEWRERVGSREGGRDQERRRQDAQLT